MTAFRRALRALLATALAVIAVSAVPALAQETSNLNEAPAGILPIGEGPRPPLKVAWHELPDDPSDTGFTPWPVVKDGIVYAYTGGGVIAVEGTTGKQLWWRDHGDALQITPAVDDRAVYIGLSFGNITAFDRNDTSEIWNFTAEDDLAHSPTVDGDGLFFGIEWENLLYRLNTADGSVVWRTATDMSPGSRVAVGSGVAVLRSWSGDSPDDQLAAFDAASGGLIWKRRIPEQSGAPSIIGDKVVFGRGDGSVEAVVAATGETEWKSAVDGRFDAWVSPVGAFGDVFVSEASGAVMRLSGETGKLKWRFDDAAGSMSQSAPVVAGRTLYAGDGAGWLYAMDVDSGRLQWRKLHGGVVMSGAADAERFYFGTKFGNEGLWAYEHDPNPPLAATPQPGRSSLADAGSGLATLVAFVAVIWMIGRRRGWRRA